MPMVRPCCQTIPSSPRPNPASPPRRIQSGPHARPDRTLSPAMCAGFPSSPGVYRMLDAARRRHLRRQGAQPESARDELRAAGGPHQPHRPHDRGDRVDGVRHGPHRGRGAAARSQPDQALPPALQRAAARRQVVPLHPDRRATTRPRRSSSIAARATARATTSARSPRPAPSTAPSTCCSGRSCCAPARTACSRAARAPACCYQIKRCSAPCTGEIGAATTTARWSRRRRASSRARARMSAQMYQRLMQEAADKLDFEHAAKYRNRLWALAHVTADQSINPEGIEEADVFAAHQDGGQTCVQVFFFRTGQNWGNRAYFPRADRSLAVEEVLESFIAQFYDDKPVPRLILLSHDCPEPRTAGGGALHQGRAQGRDPRASARRQDRPRRACARKRPRGAGAPAGRKLLAAHAARRPCRALRTCAARRAASRSSTTATSRAPTPSAP